LGNAAVRSHENGARKRSRFGGNFADGRSAVCKITDYGKYLYQANKKAHEQRKSSRGSALKEVKFRPNTAEHDFQVRKNQIIRFLGEGHKVRAMIFHRGREMGAPGSGRAKMTRLLGEIGEHGQN